MGESAMVVRAPHPDHVVQFYEDSDFLLEEVSHFLARGLRAGDAGVVIATKRHRDGLEERLRTLGFDVAGARQAGRCLFLDAADTMSQFMVGERPDENHFLQSVGGALTRAQAKAESGRVSAFGEMVALLWSGGYEQAAVSVEKLWNDLSRSHDVSLVCAYPMNGFRAHVHGKAFFEICSEHGRVLPAESYAALAAPHERLRAIAELQQKAEALEAEVERRKESEKTLAAANRSKDEFLAMLGHELRNPLTPLVTALHLARLRCGEPATLARSLDVIERQTKRLTRLVDDLLDVSRITSGHIELREHTIELSELVEQAVEQARPLLEERGHRLVLGLPEEPIFLHADSVRLEQILANLLINAAKYTDVGGRISLTARREAADVVVSVKDNGIGLTPELRERVFDLFVQSPESTARGRGGLGVGLTLVKRLVELHGGTVEARSEGPGLGSEFVFRLPDRVLEAPQLASAAGSGEACLSPRRKCRILVVDDNADVAQGLADLLRELGHQVRTAEDGTTAIKEALSLRPEVVFLDIAMPGIDGHEVARRLRTEVGLRLSTLVAISGYGQESDRQLSLEAGFDHHLAKPICIEKLMSLLGEPRRALTMNEAGG